MNKPPQHTYQQPDPSDVRQDSETPQLRLIRKLRSIRRYMRIVLVLEGWARLIVTTIGCLLVAGLLDWFVRFPAMVRACFLLTGASVAGIYTYRRIWKPLCTPIPLEQLVVALERLPGTTRDVWATAISHVSDRAGVSREMWSRIVEETDCAAQMTVPARMVRFRSAAVALLAAITSCGLVFLIGWWVPWAVLIGADRFARPMSGAQWPRKHVIEPITRDAVVAFGETFTVEMRLLKGDSPAVRGFVMWQAGSQPAETSLLRRDADGVYRLSLENLRQPVRYSFRAGDDDTSLAPFLLRVVNRPEVEWARLRIQPPSYAAHLPIVEDSLEDHDAEAMAGSDIQIEVLPSKLISGIGVSRAEIVFEDGACITMQRSIDTARTLHAEFPTRQGGAFRVRLVDSQGLESRSTPTYRLRVRPDTAPVVMVTEPEAIVEATPEARIEMRIIAHDDVGLAYVGLRYGRTGNELDHEASLLSEANPTEPPLRVELTHRWELASMNPSVGEVFEYFAEARDRMPPGDESREPSRSAIGRVLIISPARYAERLQSDLMSVREQIRTMILALLESRDQTVALEAGPARQTALTDAQRSEAEQLASGLHRLREVSEAHIKALGDLVRRADQNRLGAATASAQAERLSRRLSQTAPHALNEAASSLERSARSELSQEQQRELHAAGEKQTELIESLQSLVREMEQWNEYEDFVRRLREGLDRQEALERETMLLARRIGDHASESEPPSLASRAGGTRQADRVAMPAHELTSSREFARTTASQMQLRGEMAEVMSAMQDWSSAQGEKDRATSDALRDALNVGYRLMLLEKMDEAAGALQSAQHSGAAQAQRDAAAALRAMISALGDRPHRQLAELSRDLDDVRGRLLRLIRSQETLIDRTESASDAADRELQQEELADRQTNLGNTARRIAKMLQQDDEDARFAREQIQLSAEEMATASRWLDQSAMADALTRQRTARDLLNEALAALQDFQDRVDEERGQRSLDAIVEALRILHGKQQVVRTETAEVDARLMSAEELSRADQLRLTRLAKSQRELLEPAAQVREQLGESLVYVYLMDRVIAAIERSAERLSAHVADEALIEQDHILRDLLRLIESARERSDDKQPKFVQEGSGGGTGTAGQPTASKPVPTLAELKILKLLQSDISDDTAAADSRIPEAEHRSELDQQVIESLGKRQREVRELANRMVQSAAKDR